MRVRTAHFPQVKTLEDFNLDHLPSLRKDVLAHLATAMFVRLPRRSWDLRWRSPA
jgi:DNA replication protein DnaC